MLERSPYPLLALKLLGTACPCLEKEGDGPARRAAWAVSSVRIRWHRRPRPSSSSSSSSSVGGGGVASVGGFISAVFGAAGGGGGPSSLVVPLVGATLSVVDSPSGPRLVASAPPGGGGVGVRPKCVPLRTIRDAIREHRGGSGLGGGGGPRSGIAVMNKAGRTVLRFDVLVRSRTTTTASSAGDDDDDEGESEEGGGGGWDEASEAITDAMVRHIAALIEWEKRRRDYITTLGEDDADGVDEDDDVDEYDDDGTTPASPRSGGRKGVIAEQGEFSSRTTEGGAHTGNNDASRGTYALDGFESEIILFSFSCPLIIVIPLSLSLCVSSPSLLCGRGARSNGSAKNQALRAARDRDATHEEGEGEP
jgi:hypothetical protein